MIGNTRQLAFSVLALSLAFTAHPAAATSTSAHAMTVSGLAGHPGGGQFDCATSGPQPMSGHYFGSASVGLPTEGYAYCNLAGGIQDFSNASGISTAHQSVSNSFSHGLHTQTADATADFGVLKASSKGSYTGDAIGGFAYHDGEAAAYSTDTLLIPLGVKSIQFGLTIDGSASTTAYSQSLTELVYQVNSGPIFTIFAANLTGATNIATVRGLNGSSFEDVAGYTTLPGSLSGSGTVFSLITDVSGATFDLTLALLATSYPQQSGGIATNDFSETARLSSFRFLDASGAPIDATVTGASGRIYDASGVHTAPVGGVPEPATWAMLLIGFGSIGAVTRHRRCQLNSNY